jgi:hypothetical protein
MNEPGTTSYLSSLGLEPGERAAEPAPHPDRESVSVAVAGLDQVLAEVRGLRQELADDQSLSQPEDARSSGPAHPANATHAANTETGSDPVRDLLGPDWGPQWQPGRRPAGGRVPEAASTPNAPDAPGAPHAGRATRVQRPTPGDSADHPAKPNETLRRVARRVRRSVSPG